MLTVPPPTAARTPVVPGQEVGSPRGVLGVESNVSDPGQYVAEARVRRDLGDKLWAVLFPKGGA